MNTHNTHSPVSAINTQELFGQLQETVNFLHQAFETGRGAHEVEEELWRRMLELGRCAYGSWLEVFGSGDAGETLVGVDGRTLKRLEPLRRREYQSVFGPFELERAVYGTREGQAIEAVPLDARLNLPQCKTSYLLQDWEQRLTVEVPFATVSATLDRILGFPRSVYTLERNQQDMAQSAAAFWEAKPLPPPEEEGAILVCTADGKGVPMRRKKAPNKPPLPASSAHGLTDKPPEQAPAPSMVGKDLHPSGPRPGTKKMALLGSVYTINPVIRTPEEVLEALCSPAPSVRDTKRPKPCHKHVRAALERDGDDTTASQVATIFNWIAEQAQARNPSADKPIVLLMDGQESLWNAGWEARSQRDEEVTEVLDLMHALGYLWDAARVFYPKAPSGPEAVAFVQQQAGRLLHGQVETVLRSLRWLGTHHALTGKPPVSG